MTARHLIGLRAIGVRYRNSRPARDDERALDAYLAAGVYEESRAPVDIVEPRFPEHRRSGIESDDVGLLCGLIADEVAAARADNKVVLMSGGNCVHATGVLGGLQDAHGLSSRIGLVWFDAHGDFNTPETSPSGSLGGMPVAVAAGLAHPRWRELSHVTCPLPADRILLVDARDLDDSEERLVRALGVPVAAVSVHRPGMDLERSVVGLAERSDLLYLHVDSDVLDGSLVPNLRSAAAGGPGLTEVLAAIDTVMATGKVGAFAVVSVSSEGHGHETAVRSGMELIRGGLRSWRGYGAHAGAV